MTVTDGDSGESLPPDQLGMYLARHGVGCEVAELPGSGRHPAEVLLEAAESRDAGYVVLGVYGHSRLLEMVFGGVTRRILIDPPLPLILAH